MAGWDTLPRQRIRLYKSTRCPEIVTRFMATDNNRGINCPTWCPVLGPHEVSSVRDSDSERERERERESSRGLSIEDGGFNSWCVTKWRLVSRGWRIHFVCYSYSYPQSVIITCTYDLWVSNRSIHQSKPRLQVTNTRDNTNSRI
jgi:hypothetical protein